MGFVIWDAVMLLITFLMGVNCNFRPGWWWFPAIIFQIANVLFAIALFMGVVT